MKPGKTLRDLYLEHAGKGSDKWNSYLDAYERHLADQKSKLRSMLEIGVQNGGSLEIWSKYFTNAENILGVDIDQNVAKLSFDDKRIGTYIGNAATTDFREAIDRLHPDAFDLIIDDGSHSSGDIVRTFALLFDKLKIGGIFVIEDLHCSYWDEWEGGLHDPYSSISFFKKLIDVINHEHWGIESERREILAQFESRYKIQFSERILEGIASIEFVNSMCFIYKTTEALTHMAPRLIVGVNELVANNQHVKNVDYQAPSQKHNYWTILDSPIEDAYSDLQARKLEIDALKAENASQRSSLTHFATQLELSELHAKNNEKHILELQSALAEKERDHQALSTVANEYIGQYHAMQSSLSWKITAPLRGAARPVAESLTFLKGMTRILKDHGIKHSIHEGVNVLRNEGLSKALRIIKNTTKTHETLPALGERVEIKKRIAGVIDIPLQTNRIHIVAELTLPQCKKYRVDQKVELLKSIGFEVSVTSWNDLAGSQKGIETANAVIFYRVPYFHNVEVLINDCGRMNIPTYWEVDDLIFDADAIRGNSGLKDLDKATFDGLIQGAHLYKRAMLSCDFGIASTPPLREQMILHGCSDVIVIENALDQLTLQKCESIASIEKKIFSTDVRIVYGSGTNTHNADFLEASDAIVAVLKKYRHVRFRVIGSLSLPKEFDNLREQVEVYKQCGFDEYLEKLSECEISIAPLENVLFNYSKSNIKYIEASILSLPSVCSALPNFADVITNGTDGFTCRTTEDWVRAFEMLIESSDLRKRIGLNALNNVYSRFLPQKIAEKLQAENGRAAELLNGSQTREKKRILSVNCYYAPRTFGGATVVAEAMNAKAVEQGEFEVVVLTTLSPQFGNPYELIRYQHQGHICFGLVLPDGNHFDHESEDRHMDEVLTGVIRDLKPDLVHMHSIQGIGVALPKALVKLDVPYVITAHDFWWLMDKGLFIQSVKHLDKGAESLPVNALEYVRDRFIEGGARARSKLDAAKKSSAILVPSKFSHSIYRGMGLDQVRLNKNGVALPKDGTFCKIQKKSKVVFGYMDGNTSLKGFHLIKQVFLRLNDPDVFLLIVDNAMNLGDVSFLKSDLSGLSNVEIRPGFKQDELDDFFSEIDVFLHPSQVAESFGLTIREAMARNVWVITSDAGGSAEDTQSGVNGFVIPFDNNVVHLERAVKESIELIRNGRPGNSSNLDIRGWQEQYEELAGVYREFLSKGKEV